MFGGDDVSDVDGLAAITHEGNMAAHGERRFDVFPTRSNGEQVPHSSFDGVDCGLVVGNEPGQAIGAVFSLDHQVDGNISGVGVAVGHHTDLGRPCERRRHTNDARDLTFR